MTNELIIIGVTAGAFISTNLDNLLLLVAMYSRYQHQPGMVTAGYVTGMTLVAIATLAIGEVGGLIPLDYLGFLGVIPMMMGVFALLKLFRNAGTDDSIHIASGSSRLAVFMALMSIQLSNSADSILTFSTLFADSADPADYVVAPTFFVMVGIFSTVAYNSVRHPRLSQFLGRYGPYVTPFILMLVGYYILSDTASDLGPI